MNRIIMATLVVALAFGSVAAHATTGPFVPGVSGIKGATLPPPGLYVKLYATFVDVGSYRDGDGDKMRAVGDNGNSETDIFVFTTRFTNTFDYKILGGDPILDICIPFNYVQVNMPGDDQDKLSLGDTLFQTLLAWHGERWDAVAGPGVYLPVGSKSEMGAGKDYYTWLLNAGATVYFDAAKTWSFSAIGRLEGHLQNNADRTPGYAVHGEFGLGKNLSPNVIAGVAATAYKQISDDKGKNKAAPWKKDEKYQGFSVGPEFQFTTKGGSVIEVRYLWQLGVENGTQGSSFFLNFVTPL